MTRERDPEARHGNLVSLTEAGWEAADVGLVATDEWNARLYENLTDDELEALRQTMERIALRSQRLRDEQKA